jgi:DNA-binding IscR family transcriptional regulator
MNPAYPTNDSLPWTFLTNYSHVLLCIAHNPDVRIRDIALAVGITERAVQRILADLVETGYLESVKQGRRNHYRIHDGLTLRHPLERHRTIGDILELIVPRWKKNYRERNSSTS